LQQLQAKINEKNQVIAKLQNENIDPKLSIESLQRKYSEQENMVKKQQEEISKLRLRYENRSAPYFTVIQQFFEKNIGKFVDESHTCKCN
jgi:chromosome segregation ATPase